MMIWDKFIFSRSPRKVTNANSITKKLIPDINRGLARRAEKLPGGNASFLHAFVGTRECPCGLARQTLVAGLDDEDIARECATSLVASPDLSDDTAALLKALQFVSDPEIIIDPYVANAMFRATGLIETGLAASE